VLTGAVQHPARLVCHRAGVIVLRITQPDLPRPYRCWGYPVTPLLFLAVSLWMMWHIMRSNP
jgi:APA family basic amino acid/polyamine antiporter